MAKRTRRDFLKQLAVVGGAVALPAAVLSTRRSASPKVVMGVDLAKGKDFTPVQDFDFIVSTDLTPDRTTVQHYSGAVVIPLVTRIAFNNLSLIQVPDDDGADIPDIVCEGTIEWHEPKSPLLDLKEVNAFYRQRKTGLIWLTMMRENRRVMLAECIKCGTVMNVRDEDPSLEHNCKSGRVVVTRQIGGLPSFTYGSCYKCRSQFFNVNNDNRLLDFTSLVITPRGTELVFNCDNFTQPNQAVSAYKLV